MTLVLSGKRQDEEWIRKRKASARANRMLRGKRLMSAMAHGMYESTAFRQKRFVDEASPVR